MKRRIINKTVSIAFVICIFALMYNVNAWLKSEVEANRQQIKTDESIMLNIEIIQQYIKIKSEKGYRTN